LRDIERGDPVDAAFAFLQACPKRFEIVPEWGDNTDTSDYDSSTVIHDGESLNR
jgi:hypothetical protein